MRNLILLIILLVFAQNSSAQFPLADIEQYRIVTDLVKNGKVSLLIDDVAESDDDYLTYYSKINVSLKQRDRIRVDLNSFDTVYMIRVKPYNFEEEWSSNETKQNTIRGIFFPDNHTVERFGHEGIYVLYNDFDVLIMENENYPYDEYDNTSTLIQLTKNSPNIKSMMHQLKVDEFLHSKDFDMKDDDGLFYVREFRKMYTIYQRMYLGDFDYLKSRVSFSHTDPVTQVTNSIYYGAISNNRDLENTFSETKDQYKYTSIIGPYKTEVLQKEFTEMCSIIWNYFDSKELQDSDVKKDFSLLKTNKNTRMILEMKILEDKNATGFSYVEVSMNKLK